jgi:hypothetical protein
VLMDMCKINGMVVSALEAYKKKVSMVERCNLWLLKGDRDSVFRWKMTINAGICKVQVCSKF